MNAVVSKAIKLAIETLVIARDRYANECDCEPCRGCGNMPSECSDTECSKTCQCSICDFCRFESALEKLRLSFICDVGEADVKASLEQAESENNALRAALYDEHHGITHTLRVALFENAIQTILNLAPGVRLGELLDLLRRKSMDKQYMETEFNTFFEFDSDDRSVVTSTSAKMFAEHMAAPIEAQVEQLTTALEGVLPFLTGEYWPGVVADAAVDRAIAAVRKVGADDTALERPNRAIDTDARRAPENMVADAARWRYFADSPQTALMLGSTLDPHSEQDWITECSRLADSLISANDLGNRLAATGRREGEND